MNPVTKIEAAKELLARRAARRSFPAFIAYVNPAYSWQWFHTILADEIDRWIEGDFKNLIINMPPRNGKSEQASRLAPAYILGRNPNATIIASSYSADLAQRMNRDVQRIIESRRYANVFPQTRLNTANVRSDAKGSYLRNSDIFEIVGYSGVYRGAGRGGGITGMGGDFLIVDDPIKDKEEAKSSTIKDAAFEYLTTTLFTRQADDNARKLMIATRWAIDDPIGRILELCDPTSENYNPEAENWRVLTLPALAYEYDDPDRDIRDTRAPGTPLWPSKFSRTFLMAQRAINAEDFEALQQQKPISKGTAKFQRQWFPIVPTSPRVALRVRYWDKAGTEGGGAYTVGTLLSFDGTYYYVEDVIRVQLAYAEREALIRSVADTDYRSFGRIDLGSGISPISTWIEQEPGSGGKESAERTILQLSPYPVYAERVTGSKEVRANGFSAQAMSGNVRVVSADWNEVWLKEISNFPKGKFKDQVDSASGAFNKLSLGWEEETVVSENVYQAISPF